MVDGRLILIARLFMLNCFYSRRITVFSCFKFVVPFQFHSFTLESFNHVIISIRSDFMQTSFYATIQLNRTRSIKKDRDRNTILPTAKYRKRNS